MKTMSFNILCYGSGENEWTKRIPAVVRTIRKADPDTFGVQEAHWQWMKALIGAFPDYEYIGVGRDDGKKKGEFAAIFYKKDKLKLLEKGNFWLSKNQTVPGLGWDAACIRICSFGVFEVKETKVRFAHFNTHLDHVGVIAMKKGAELVAERAAKTAERMPVIVTGDFNVTPESEAIKAMEAAGFCDTRQLAKTSDTSATYHGFCEDDPQKHSIIDYIFIKGDVKVNGFKVIKKHIDGQIPSDHYPVFARLKI